MPTSNERSTQSALSSKQRRFQTFLLQGVTGSGKTEVYLQAAARALSVGRGALILVPEIALTHDLVERVCARFGDGRRRAAQRTLRRRALRRVAAARERRGAHRGRRALRRVRARRPTSGSSSSTRSTMRSYKQEEGLRYNARDLAIVRARDCSLSRGARLGDALDREPSQRAERPLPPARAPRARRAPAAATSRARGPEEPSARRGSRRCFAPRVAEAIRANFAARRADAAVPQPARLRALPAVHALRLRHGVPELQRDADVPPALASRALPPLRPFAARAGPLPAMREPPSARFRHRHGAGRVGGARAHPASAGRAHGPRHDGPQGCASDAASRLERRAARRARRHADGDQGSRRPWRDARRRRRSGPDAQFPRLPRRRAHVPAADPGGRPSGTRRPARPRARADLPSDSLRGTLSRWPTISPASPPKSSATARRSAIRRSPGSRTCASTVSMPPASSRALARRRSDSPRAQRNAPARPAARAFSAPRPPRSSGCAAASDGRLLVKARSAGDLHAASAPARGERRGDARATRACGCWSTSIPTACFD